MRGAGGSCRPILENPLPAYALPRPPPLIRSRTKHERDVIGVEGVNIGVELSPVVAVTVGGLPCVGIPEVVHLEELGPAHGFDPSPSTAALARLALIPSRCSCLTSCT